LEAEVGVMPRSPKGRAAARGLDARLRLQHAFMPAGDASLKTAQLIKMLVDSNHGIYREIFRDAVGGDREVALWVIQRHRSESAPLSLSPLNGDMR
jgi:hypothetical protein